MDYVLGPPIREQNGGCLVRLADDARKCVAYLGYRASDDDSEIEPIATGFLVSAGRGTFLVTARHVAEDFGSDPFVVRLNDKNGVGKNDHVDKAEWFFHPNDENIDVAILEYSPPDWTDYVPFPRKAFLSEFKLGTKKIGPGDIAYVVGVFSLLHGKRRNIPAVHTGNIALMADDEPIPLQDWRDPASTIPMETFGYLVEAQTLPGTSGGPVFVRRAVDMKAAHGNLEAWSYGSVWLLGLWQGSWYGAPERYLKLPTADDEDVKVALGVGVVIPAIQIIEALEHRTKPKTPKGDRLLKPDSALPEKRRTAR
jgi:hypothetical protein